MRGEEVMGAKQEREIRGPERIWSWLLLQVGGRTALLASPCSSNYHFGAPSEELVKGAAWFTCIQGSFHLYSHPVK